MTELPRPRFEDKPLARHFKPGTLSVLVFGPGHGEALVVLFPDLSVGVIDGCREPRNGHPSGRGDPVREFLDDWYATHAKTRVRLRFVALTHPHDDHYKGLGRLIEAYDEAIDEIWCTHLTGGRYASAFLEYEQICEANPDEVPGAEDCSGLTRIYAGVASNPSRIRFMQRDRTLLRAQLDGRRLRIRSIAPSDNDDFIAQQDLARTIGEAAQSGDSRRARHDPNFTSAALLVSWGKSQVLLGGDLLCQHGQYEGWSRAASSIEGKVQVVKAAHHASAGAQDWALWQRMTPKLAIVTPFKEAANNYPPQPDILRRLSTSAQLAITSPPRWVASGHLPQPTRVTAIPRNVGRNSALGITASPVPQNDAVGVSLDANGNITQIILTGRADLYR